VGVPVQHVDLLPTVLAATGSPQPAEVHGENLIPLLQGAAAAWPGRSIVSLLDVDLFEIVSVIGDGKHLIRWDFKRPSGRQEVYDLASDPRELVDVHDRAAVSVGYLLGLLRDARSLYGSAGEAPQVEISPETEEQLRALGYVR
jgi:arylsulfatase A-like enzyme